MKLIPRGSGEVIEIDRRLANRSPRLEGYFGDEEVVIDAQAQDVRDYIHFLKTGEIRDPDLINTIFPRMGHGRCPRDIDPGYCAAAFEDDWFQKYGDHMEGLISMKTVVPPPEYALGQPYFYVGETAMKWMGILPSDQPGILIAFLETGVTDEGDSIPPELTINSVIRKDVNNDYVVIEVGKLTWEKARTLTFNVPDRGRRLNEDEFFEPEAKIGDQNLLPETEEDYFKSWLWGIVPGDTLAPISQLSPIASTSLALTPIVPSGKIYTVEVPGEDSTQDIVIDTTLYRDVAHMAHTMFPPYEGVVMNQSGQVWMTRKAWWIHSHKTIYLKMMELASVYSSYLLALKDDVAQYSIKFLDLREDQILSPLQAISAMEYLMADYYYGSFQGSVKTVIGWLRHGVPSGKKRPDGREIMIPVDREDQRKMKFYAYKIVRECDRIIKSMSSFFVEAIYQRWLIMGKMGIPIYNNRTQPWLLHAQLLMQYNFAFNSPKILTPMTYPLEWTSTILWDQ